jgi:membrane-associated phospholipid phosphatase
MYLLSFIDTLVRLDRELFTFVNSVASSPSIDWLFKSLRNAYTWIPLYAFVLYWVLSRHRKYAWQFILFTLVVFAVTDFVSASVLKPMFARLRPCHDPVLQPVLRDLVGCGGQYGMPSSHASNHFGLASFWYFTITWMSKRRWWWLWLWAILVCYAQVYVGKHFPGDIIVGAVFGTCVGILLALLYRTWLFKSQKK